MTKSNFDYVRKMLCARLAVTNVDRRCYPAGFATSDDLITSNRYILVVRGAIDYEVEGSTTQLTAGNMLFVPAWVRRQWRTVGEQGCENIWCEFSSLSLNVDLHTLFCTDEISAEEECGSLERMRGIWKRSRRRPSYFPDLGHTFSLERTEDPIDLQLEGELKASLSRFWTCQKFRHGTHSQELQHPEIRKALRLMETYFSKADALETIYRELELTPNYFRSIFKQQIKIPPREFLHGLRMRHARHLIQHSKRSVKEIAFSVGFTDPLYFSRQYTAFWGASPRADRQFN